MKKGLLVIIIVVVAVCLIFIEQSSFFPKLTGKATQTGDVNCTDADGRTGFYTKGVTVGKATFDSQTESYFDYCFNNTDSNTTRCKGYGCSVYEYFCGYRGLVNYVVGLCPYGCIGGRCLTGQENIEAEEQPEINETEEISTEPKTEIIEEKPTMLTKIIDFFKTLFKR